MNCRMPGCRLRPTGRSAAPSQERCRRNSPGSTRAARAEHRTRRSSGAAGGAGVRTNRRLRIGARNGSSPAGPAALPSRRCRKIRPVAQKQRGSRPGRNGSWPGRPAGSSPGSNRYSLAGIRRRVGRADLTGRQTAGRHIPVRFESVPRTQSPVAPGGGPGAAHRSVDPTAPG